MRVFPEHRVTGAIGRGLAAILAAGLAGCATTRPAAKDAVPAFFDGARILFQGDSITDGNRGRNLDPNHIPGHGYQALIASRYGADFSERHLLFLNRGISGNRVASLERRWQTDALDLTPDLTPDLLSNLVGVNDLTSGVTAALYEEQYDQLLATKAPITYTRDATSLTLMLPEKKIGDYAHGFKIDGPGLITRAG